MYGEFIEPHKPEQELKIMRRAKATREQLRARLGLRSSNAARPHKNKARAEKLPGRDNRAAQQRRAISEQER